MIADSFDPRIVGVQIAPVAYVTGHVLVVRVSQSVQGLHRSKLDQHFHIRDVSVKPPPRCRLTPALASLLDS
jgi:hypothetical protein